MCPIHKQALCALGNCSHGLSLYRDGVGGGSGECGVEQAQCLPDMGHSSNTINLESVVQCSVMVREKIELACAKGDV